MRRPREQQRLDAAMLVAELDLEMLHALAVAHEPEVAGLDHARVDRADADLVDVLAAHREERVPAHPLLPRAFEAHGLQPRMAVGHEAGLFPQFALEHLRRGESLRERRVVRAVVGGRAQQAQAGCRGLHDGRHDDAGCGAASEQRHEPVAGDQRIGARVDQRRERQRREFARRGGHGGRVRLHQCPPIDCATRISSAFTGAGT